jgi:hypothetical protein
LLAQHIPASNFVRGTFAAELTCGINGKSVGTIGSAYVSLAPTTESEDSLDEVCFWTRRVFRTNA